MEKNLTGTKNDIRSKGMKRKREDDAINENVMAILTTATSCSCQESSSELCYIHGQPVKFEGDPKLLEEKKKKKREYNKNRQQDLRRKERLLLGKPTEDLTPEELEEVQKIKEKKKKYNLDLKNRYHSRREKAKEKVTSDPEVLTVLDTFEASKTAEASEADSASHDADEHDFYENMDISESQTLADLATQESSTFMTHKKPCQPRELTEMQMLERKVKLNQQARNWYRIRLEKERILLEKPTEDLTPEELEMLQKIREKKNRKNLYMKNRYDSLTVEQKEEKKKEKKDRFNLYLRNRYHSLSMEQRKEMNARKNARRRQKASGKSLQKTEEVEAKIDQDDQLLDDSFSRNSVKSRDSTTHDSNKHESNEDMDISTSKTFEDSATPDSRNTTKTNLAREELTELQKIQRNEVAKRNYSELSQEKTKGLSKREEKDNNLEPLDENNLKMLPDNIQSLGPADQEKVGAE